MSDNELDVDAELLALAGDGSDDDGDVSAEEVADREPSEEAKPSVEQVDEPPASSRKGVAQKVRARRRTKRKQDSEEKDDLDDGSPSPSASLGSGAMDESDGDADAPASPIDDDAPLYPVEGQYLSARDREEILALPEIKREEILAERAAEVTKRQQDIQLKKALASASAAANKHKRKAAAADLDDTGTARRSTRPKAEKGRSALDDYRRARELKGTERGRLDAGRSRRDERSPSSVGSDRDAQGESEVEWAEPSSDGRYGRDEPPAEMRDFEHCRVGRSNFAKVCFYPKFEEVIRGCFCRVSIGINRDTGQNQYRMTQVKGFTEGKPYNLEGANGKTFQTDQYALVAHGQAEKPWPFSACSDSKFVDAEFDRYIDTFKRENLKLPTRKALERKLQDINGLLNMEWTEDAISQKLKKQRDMERRLDPANAARMKRDAVEKRKLDAEEQGDADEVMRCEAELAALSNQAANVSLNGSVKISPMKKTAAGIQQERLAQLNMKNRGKNAEEVRKALIEEKKKIIFAREQALQEAKAKAAADAVREEEERRQKELLAVPRSDMSDLFGDGSDISRAATPVNGVGTPRRSRAGTPLNGVKKEKSALGPAAAVGAIKKKNLDDDVIGGLDLGIDVDI